MSSQPTDPQQSATLDVKPGFIFLAFFLFFFRPRISINGSAPVAGKWGSNPFPVPPGRYQVEVWVPYLFFKFMGRNGIVVDVPAGSRVEVVWRAPWLAFLQGKIRASGPFAPDGAAPPVMGAQPGLPAGWAAPPGAAAPPVQQPEPSVVAASQQQAPAGQAADGWYPDPTARHELRWFDGSTWTAHVSDRGATGTDPLQP